MDIIIASPTATGARFLLRFTAHLIQSTSVCLCFVNLSVHYNSFYKKMSVVPEKESLKEERERLVAHTSTLQGHLSTMQSRIQEIDLELEGGEGGKGVKKRAGETSPSQSPLRSARPSILAKAKALVDLVVNADASSETIYLLRAAEEAKVIDSRDNIAKLIGGPAPALVNMVRRPLVAYIVVLLWVVSAVLGILVMVKLLDDWVSIVCPFLTIPSVLYVTLRMSRLALWELCTRFDTLYCTGNTLVAAATLCMLVKDYRIVYLVGSFFPSVMVIVLSDALPPKVRNFSAKFCMSIGIINCIIGVAALYFNWCDVEPIVFQVGFITVSMASLATNGLMNVALLFVKFMVSAIRWENSFSIIKSRMEVIPTTKELADVFMASYELANAKAGSIRVRSTSKKNDRKKGETLTG